MLIIFDKLTSAVRGSFFLYYTIILLHYYTITLLHYYTIILLHYYTITLLHYYTITLLHYYTITLLHYYTITLLHYYTITLLHYFMAGCCSRCTNVELLFMSMLPPPLRWLPWLVPPCNSTPYPSLPHPTSIIHLNCIDCIL